MGKPPAGRFGRIVVQRHHATAGPRKKTYVYRTGSGSTISPPSSSAAESWKDVSRPILMSDAQAWIAPTREYRGWISVCWYHLLPQK